MPDNRQLYNPNLNSRGRRGSPFLSRVARFDALRTRLTSSFVSGFDSRMKARSCSPHSVNAFSTSSVVSGREAALETLEASLKFEGPWDTPAPLKTKGHLTTLADPYQNVEFPKILALESVSKNVSKSMVKDSEIVVKGFA